MSELDPATFSADTVIDPILEKTLFDPNPNWLVFDPDFHREPGLKREAFQTNLRIDFEHSSGYSFTSLTAFHTDKNQNVIDLNYRDGRSRPNPFAPLFIGVLGRTDCTPRLEHHAGAPVRAGGLQSGVPRHVSSGQALPLGRGLQLL